MATRFNLKDEPESDWSKYDFRTWDPAKVPGGPTSTLIGSAFGSLIASPDWPTNLASGVSALKKVLVPALNSYGDTLRQTASGLNSDLADATGAAQKQISALQEGFRSASAPPQPKTDPSSYQVAAKVVEQESKVGLPGISVTIADTRNPDVSLSSATTDLAGNAILKVTERQIAEAESGLVLQVVSPEGKEFFSAQLCPKLNQTETVVAAIETPSELSQQRDLAKSVVSQQQDLISSITTHIDAMKTLNDQAKNDLLQELDHVQGMIDDLK